MFQRNETAAERTDTSGRHGMRTEDGRPGRAKAAGGQVQPGARRFFGVAAVVGALAAATLALSMLVANPALADGSAHDSNDAVDKGGRCNGADRLPKDAATCLTASWDNTGNADWWGGTFRVKNECGDIGKMIAHVDVKDETDLHVHLDNSTAIDSGAQNDINSITCCLNKADKLCIKQQVVPVNGKIKRVRKGDDGRYYTGDRNVSDQGQRYLYCANFPNEVYCKLTDDDIGPPESWCGSDRKCTRQDCEDHWRGSKAWDNGCRHTWIERKKPDTTNDFTEDYTCKIWTVTCPDDDGVTQSLGNTRFIPIKNMWSFNNCDGKLGNHWCNSIILSGN